MIDYAENLVPVSSDPRARIELGRKSAAARLGYDIVLLTPWSWTVCTLCGLPASESPSGPASICCGRALRVQGWVAARQAA